MLQIVIKNKNTWKHNRNPAGNAAQIPLEIARVFFSRDGGGGRIWNRCGFWLGPSELDANLELLAKTETTPNLHPASSRAIGPISSATGPNLAPCVILAQQSVRQSANLGRFWVGNQTTGLFLSSPQTDQTVVLFSRTYVSFYQRHGKQDSRIVENGGPIETTVIERFVGKLPSSVSSG